MCVAPVAVSKVSNENAKPHGTPEVKVSWISPRISPRTLDSPALENGRLAEEI
jgi:hypothetical protein